MKWQQAAVHLILWSLPVLNLILMYAWVRTQNLKYIRDNVFYYHTWLYRNFMLAAVKQDEEEMLKWQPKLDKFHTVHKYMTDNHSKHWLLITIHRMYHKSIYGEYKAEIEEAKEWSNELYRKSKIKDKFIKDINKILVKKRGV